MMFDPLALRVAARFFRASLAHEFEQRLDKLLAMEPNPPKQDVAEFRKWVIDNFNWTRASKDAKRAKEEIDRFWRSLEHFATHDMLPGAFQGMVGARVHEIKAEIPQWVAFFSAEGGGKAVTREKKIGSNTYVNLVGTSDKNLDAMIQTIEGVFHELKGWRKQALSGGITVVFAGPKDFKGSASGRYDRAGDRLWIRATAGGRIEKAGGGGYGSLSYVITHELAHRYEAKHHQPFDFDPWYTTPYSKSRDGESFAELFALSNFSIGGTWTPTVKKFEELMGG